MIRVLIKKWRKEINALERAVKVMEKQKPTPKTFGDFMQEFERLNHIEWKRGMMAGLLFAIDDLKEQDAKTKTK